MALENASVVPQGKKVSPRYGEVILPMSSVISQPKRSTLRSATLISQCSRTRKSETDMRNGWQATWLLEVYVTFECYTSLHVR